MFRVFEPKVLRFLEAADATITFVDVGARNGVIELPALAARVEAYGFEPNPAEYEKLTTGQTDLALLGVQPPPYRSLRNFPYAIADTDGRKSLFVSRAAAVSCLVEPNMDRLREIVWKGRRYEPNLGDAIFSVEKTVEVETRRLDTFADDAGLDHVDYLKVDVEGTEYDVFAGAARLLPRVGVIRTEVCFVPVRVGQRLFSEVDLLLREYGFDLLRYEIDTEQVGYKERETAAVFGPTIGYADRYGQPIVGDAIYVNRSIQEPARALAQAAVLIDKNYLDEALFILKRKTEVEDPELFELLRTYREVRLQHRVFGAGNAMIRASRLIRHPVHALRTSLGWRRVRRERQAPEESASSRI